MAESVWRNWRMDFLSTFRSISSVMAMRALTSATRGIDHSLRSSAWRRRAVMYLDREIPPRMNRGGGPFSASDRSLRGLASLRGDSAMPTADVYGRLEKDHGKAGTRLHFRSSPFRIQNTQDLNTMYPNFKSNLPKENLLLDGKLNHPPVKGEVTAVPTANMSIHWWNKALARCVKDRQYEKAMNLFQQMQQECICPDKFTYIRVLGVCSTLQALEDGRLIHTQIIRSGWESDVYVGSSLVDMYAKCQSIEEAWGVFNRLPTRDVVTWTNMILGFVKCGQGLKALEISHQMEHEGVEPNSFTFVGLLSACASVKALEEGRNIHAQIIQRGCESDVFVGNSLVDMYAKCGSIEDAWNVFCKIPKRDNVVWATMILGYVKCGHGQKALELYGQMQKEEEIEPGPAIFVAVLNACASLCALEEGRVIHKQIVQKGCESDVFVGCSLVDMYAKCGRIEDAERVFRQMPSHDLVSWNAMLVGCLKCGRGFKALELFQEMQQEGVEPDALTFVGLLNACASVNALEEGRCVHEQIIQRGFVSDVFVTSSLVDMYAKCGSIEDALKIFNQILRPTLVSWNAMILGYVKCGQGKNALELYQQMQQDEVEPDSVTFIAALKACAMIAALDEGKNIHEQIVQRGFGSEVFVSSSLVDMYAKCGSIENAEYVFNELKTHDNIVWNSMLGGYAVHGYAKEALVHFQQMCQESVEINGVTFISLLSACSHAGLVDEGLHYFESQWVIYNIPVIVEHYACMIDLLGRAGRLYEADGLMKRMTCEQDVTVWRCLLGACRVHGNIQMGEKVAKRVLELDPENAAGYVLLSNIYTNAGEGDHSASVEQERLGMHE